MTTQAHGSIIYYDSDGGPILREVPADDVAAMESHIALLNAEVTRLQAQYDETEQMRLANYARAQLLERQTEIAAAIMRSQPVGVPPRLVQAWREAQQRVDEVRK